MPANSQSNSFDLTRLRAGTGVKPFRLHFFPRLRSTNDHAATLRKRGDLFAPAIVLTSNQIAGRGRGANTWFSAAGSLTVTFVLPIEEHLDTPQIPLIAGLAVRDAIAQLTHRDDIQLKWPNDVIHNHRKLAGLLCERVHKADLIGLGVNVNLDPRRAPKGLRHQLTSLSQITGHPLDLTDTLITIANHLHTALSRRGERPFAQTLERYDAYHCLLNRRVTVVGNNNHDPSLTGTVEGIDPQGRLLLRTRTKLERIIAGQVQLL